MSDSATTDARPPVAPAADVAAEAAGTTRRQVLATAGVVVAAAAVTAACGSSGSSPSGTGGAAASPATVGKADVPVGGGVILADREVVVTQPTAGTYKGFSAVCTHQGCVVSSVSDGKIHCACHGSIYSAADGTVEQGPATRALAPVNVTVSGDQITLA